MKIYFGFVNPDTIDKLSPALQAKDINMLKASPSQILLKGLYRIEQPGYTSYASSLPAFMYARNQGRRTPLGREGYPITTRPEDLLPLNMPLISVSYKNSEIPRPIKDFTTVKEITAKDKNLRTYTVEYKTGLLGILRASKYEKNLYPMANTVTADDLENLIIILRIVSGFLRTHKYPAYDCDEEFCTDFEERLETVKRDLTQSEYEPSIDEASKKRMISVKVDGEPTWVKPETDKGKEVVRLHYAKPVDESVNAWGAASDIPVTDGIVFPFEADLAVWDKDTVCTVIGRHFMRCLGHTTDGCLQKYSDVCTSWKRSLHRTNLGDVLSHICRVIDIAIPSQARVFPVIESSRYTGCYLAGAGFSVALRGEVYRPTTYENNQGDFDCFEGMEAILRQVIRVNTEKVDDGYEKLQKVQGTKCMRGLQKYLDTWVQTPEKMDRIRHLAARLTYPQEFLRINIENIRLVISWIKGTPIPVSTPMHAYGLGRTTTYELALSAFGPNAPSPLIPGAPKIQLSDKIPSGFNKVLAFRTTLLENAIADWKEVGMRGFTYNGPERLSARYQYVSVRGEEDKKQWFSLLHGFHLWFKDVGSKMSGNVVEIADEDEVSGGVSIGERSIQFEGF